MKRRDLKPGTFFRYDINPAHVYWVQAPGDEKPEGVIYSGPNPVSTDWDLAVTVLSRADATAAGAAWMKRRAQEAAMSAAIVNESAADDLADYDEDPGA